MGLSCRREERREAVRRMAGRNGIDYVEVSDDQLRLEVTFLGKLPVELSRPGPGLDRYLAIEGGVRVTRITITGVEPVVDPDPEKDDRLVIHLDRWGDFSTYTLRLVNVAGIDPCYDHAQFSFKIACPSDLDCAPAKPCAPPVFDEPEINYLSKDYGSFRQLLLDRLALLLPNWTERHEADLGVTLAEVLAYAGDQLSYYQDAVATEAYLDTARQRISVRRHVRLVDYRLHEGNNARAWVHLEVSGDLALDPGEVSFVTGLDQTLAARPSILSWDDLRDAPQEGYEVFEPLVADRSVPIQLRTAHNQISFYTWGDRECCLERGSTSAVLLDGWADSPPDSGHDHGGGEYGEGPDDGETVPARRLQLTPGDVLIFEEVLGPKTGLPADADRTRRHAVRLTRVTPGEDPVIKTAEGQATPYLEVEWAPEDALPFPFCISTLAPAPDCGLLANVSVARGNVVLVDHGKTVGPEPLGQVPALRTEATCECEGQVGETEIVAGPFPQAPLNKNPITFSQPLPADDSASSRWTPASRLLRQEMRSALPQVQLVSQPPEPWEARLDLIGSWSEDRHFVVEIDDGGMANLRFGDGELGRSPPAGMTFQATYRVGNGARGNVGADAISRLVLARTRLSGASVAVRNPLPAQGGIDPEPMAEAKLFAPHLFRKQLERAIVAEDYEKLAEQDSAVQRASASLTWSGSWNEAMVAIDPIGSEDAGGSMMARIAARLERARRMGHDLRLVPASYVPIDLALEVCALPHYPRGQVKAALLDCFSNRNLSGGKRGFFHPDVLSFGEGIALSRVIAAAQAVPGVQSVTVTRFQRLFEQPNREIENGLLPLGTAEIAQLDNNPNYPERGQLEINVCGGR